MRARPLSQQWFYEGASADRIHEGIGRTLTLVGSCVPDRHAAIDALARYGERQNGEGLKNCSKAVMRFVSHETKRQAICAWRKPSGVCWPVAAAPFWFAVCFVIGSIRFCAGSGGALLESFAIRGGGQTNSLLKQSPE